jgi:hypothetical protein
MRHVLCRDLLLLNSPVDRLVQPVKLPTQVRVGSLLLRRWQNPSLESERFKERAYFSAIDEACLLANANGSGIAISVSGATICPFTAVGAKVNRQSGPNSSCPVRH